MIAETIMVVAPSLFIAIAGFIAGRKIPPRTTKPKQPESLPDVMRLGFEAVDSMVKDIHALYHPSGCKCAMCEIAGEVAPEEIPDNTAYSPNYIRALESNLDSLRKENFVLRKRQTGNRVITKTIERKTPLQKQIDQVAEMADKEQQPLLFQTEIEGRSIDFRITPQRAPDAEVYKHGEPEPVRRMWFNPDPKATDRQNMQRLAREANGYFGYGDKYI